MSIDLDRLLKEISPDAPSGKDDLEHDLEFMELESAAQITPAVEVSGKIVQEEKEPNWAKVQKSALDLLKRAHDLRLAVYLTQAQLHTEGIQGFSEGVCLIRGYIKKYWDTVYPQLDPEDDNDPTLRVNVIEALTDWSTIIGPLMKARLCLSRTMGLVNLRQYKIATGKAGDFIVSEEEKKNAFNLSGIDGAFGDCDLDQLKADTEAAGAALDALRDLDTLLVDKVGGEWAPDLKELIRITGEIDVILRDQLAKRTGSKSAAAEKAGGRGKAAEQAAPAQAMGRYEQSFSPDAGSIEMVESREDVLTVLEKVCSYYELFEPASPVPLLLKRAMKLVEKNFFEIMEDLAPDSINQLEVVCGRREQQEQE